VVGDGITAASGYDVAPPKLRCGARSLQGSSGARTWCEAAMGPPKARRVLQSPWGSVENRIR
jgi:hypothetical protein